MSSSCESMPEDWRRRILASPDARDARKNLECHRSKIRELQEELRAAEEYEAELEERLSQVEDRLRPPVMRFKEKLKLDSGVDRTVVGEIIEVLRSQNCSWPFSESLSVFFIQNLNKIDIIIEEVEDPSQITALMKTKAKTLDQMTRSQLVGFMRTILHLRDAFVEEELEAGKDVMLVSL